MSDKEAMKSEINPKFKYEISKVPGAEKLMQCFQCGTCTADCPSARFSKLYKPRRIARMVQFGLKDRLLSDDHLWLCTSCYACIDHCPQDVEVASIVRVLRNIAVKEKNRMPLVSKELVTSLLKTGYVYTFPESRLKRRADQGLPPLPKANLGDVVKIFDEVGFTKILASATTFEKVEK
ncbi:MAG: 4Fe-4S dicluster domain-containing protein [Candidatus Bathyarchaeota archaeon]